MFRALPSILTVLLGACLLVATYTGGVFSGLYFQSRLPGTDASGDHDHDDEHGGEHDDHEEHEEDVVALTQEAFGNLGLKMGRLRRQNYWQHVLMPADVVEYPGRSDLSVSSPVTGVVEDVLIVPGETIEAGQALFQLRLTDESITSTQSKLLGVLAKVEVAEKEIKRLQPLTQSGVVSGTQKRTLEYEVQQLQAEKKTLIQDLIARGLSDELVDALLIDRQLAIRVPVAAPDFVRSEEPGQSSGFSIEDLNVHPGQVIRRGEPLCSLAYHRELYLRGTAFETDLSILNQVIEKEWNVTIGSDHSHVHADDADDLQLPILRIDNHVDDESQAVHFFLALPNRVQRVQQRDGRLFEQWEFRPGQRVHLDVPVQQFELQYVLPADAVVIDGPDAMVFVEHHHHDDAHEDHGHEEADEHHDEHDEHEHEVYIELEAVPVRVLHRDRRKVVIERSERLSSLVRIAQNSAQMLHLALKMQASGGGGHHHDHDH